MPPPDPPADPARVPRSPSGRVPRWVLDESAARGSRQRPARRRRPGPGLLAGSALGVALLVAAGSGALGDLTSTAGPHAVGPVVPDRATAPVGAPEPVAVTSDRWAPLETWGGEPVRWDPCRPVHYVVNPSGEPAGGRAVLDAAIERVSRASGLRFVDDGATDETERTSPVEAGLVRDSWAPVLVRWDLPAEHAEEDGQEGTVLGVGGPIAVSTTTGRPVYVSGSVGLTVDGAAPDLSAPGAAAAVGAVWRHEFAHLVGLDHVEDPSQLMNPSTTGLVDYAAGDLTGLAALGTGPCLPV